MNTEQGGVLPPEETVASFRVRVTSVHDATWQGVVEANGEGWKYPPFSLVYTG